MDFIRLTQNDYDELNKIFDDLNEKEMTEDNLWEIENNFATILITLGQEFEKLQSEVYFGNIRVENNVMTCINENGEIQQYKLIKRKAKHNEIIYIINTYDSTPLTHRHKNRFFRVESDANKELLEWVQDHVVVSMCCVYDDQYLVLEESM